MIGHEGGKEVEEEAPCDEEDHGGSLQAVLVEIRPEGDTGSK